MTVYYLQRELDKAIKIGFTCVNPRGRMSHLKTEHGPLRLIAMENGRFREEAERHRQFSAEGLGREWFRPSPRLLEHVAAVAASPGCAHLLRVCNSGSWKPLKIEVAA